MDFPDGSTRQKLPLLFVGERLLNTLFIQSARCPAQRGVKLFEVIRLNLLNLLLAELGHDKKNSLPAFTDPASMVFVFETNGVGISAPENRCHRCSLPQTAANQSSKLCLLTRMLVPRRITLKSFVVLHRLYAARLEIANSWAISSTR